MATSGSPTEQGATRTALALLALTVLFALALYLGYNVTLLQHQGRYLFPAIAPLGVFFALGLRAAWRRPGALIAAGVLLLVLVTRIATGLLASGSGIFDGLLWGGGAGLLAAWGWVRPLERLSAWPYALCFAALTLVDAWCLVGFVIPYFQ